MPAFYSLENFQGFADLLHEQQGFLLFGVPSEDGVDRGEYDILTALPEREFKLTARDAINRRALSTVLDSIKALLNPHLLSPFGSAAKPPFEPPFTGGLAGHLCYEAGYYLDRGLHALRDNLSTPLLSVGYYSWAAVRERSSGRAAIFWQADCPKAKQDYLQHLADMSSATTASLVGFRMTRGFVADQTAERYRSKVGRIQEYLRAGDAYQVNLSQRFEGCYEGSAWEAFRTLTNHHAAEFTAYANNGDYQVLSLSPERFISVNQGKVITAPIKGTRPRGSTREEDKRLLADLTNSEKDRAENLMIVDLLRNDLGKYCVTGSVQVDELFAIKSHPNVHHLVSTISAELAPMISPVDILLGAFPGGSITGAPKRRSMEIIHELEPHLRGPYCGTLFYIGHNGRMDSSIAIRTLRCQDGLIECWGGGGVVADSDPQSEYDESCVKVRRLMDILERHH